MSPEINSQLLLEPLPYSPLIPTSLHNQYAAGLASVERWVGNDFCPDTTETDYDHVLVMFKISQELRGRPILASAVDFDVVDHMIYVHDGGEVLVGDLALGRPDYSRVRGGFKRRERAALRYLIGRIPDKNTKQVLRSYAQRYEEESGDDNEALMTHFIDKIQAVRFGLEHVFNGHNLGETAGGPVIDRNFKKLEFPVTMLVAHLSSGAQGEFSSFVRGELKKVRDHGYPTKALEYGVKFGLEKSAQPSIF